MIRIIVDQIKDRMDYSFKDVHLGLVYPVSVKGQMMAGTHEGLRLQEAIPNSQRSCIVYWEDYGSRLTDECVRYRRMTQELRLIIWLNLKKLEGNFDDLVKAVVWSVPRQVGTTLTYISGELPKDTNIFHRYDYKDSKQYITHPFDAAAFRVVVKYMDVGCKP